MASEGSGIRVPLDGAGLATVKGDSQMPTVAQCACARPIVGNSALRCMQIERSASDAHAV